METIIIMTEVVTPAGRYTKFNVKDGGKLVATVDRVDGRYVIFAWNMHLFQEVATRIRKPSAIKVAQDCVRNVIPDAKFRHNIVREIWH